MSVLDNILGLGYAGAAVVNGTPLLITGSSASEKDNLMQSQAAPSNMLSLATGRIPVRNRRTLEVNLTCVGTYAAMQQALYQTVQWRALGLTASPCSMIINLANGEGYTSTEAWVQSASISVQENALTQVSFNIITYIWTDSGAAMSTPGIQQVINPIALVNQPIPHWACIVNNAIYHPGVVTSFSLNMTNDYKFHSLCEATVGPPHPRVVTPGRLNLSVQMTTLALRGARPSDRATGATFLMGAGPTTTLVIPLMTRDDRSTQSFGEQNGAIRWQSTWKAFGNSPVAS